MPHWHRELLLAIRLPFWFACFWTVAGTAWRPPLASVGLIALFLGLLVIMEWFTRRLTSKSVPKTDRDESSATTIRQQIVRSTTEKGLDRLEGTFWTEFPANAMTATIHIPFCPVFDQVPEVQVVPVDEADFLFRVTSLKTFGIRIDVKRNNMETDRLHFAVIAEGQPKK